MMKKYRILMVCLGNICRSPLAEAIMRSKLPEDKFEVDSAGTASYHIGEAPDRRACAIARRGGVDIEGLRGRKFTEDDFDDFDVIYAMDADNLYDIRSMARDEEQREKAKLILDELYPGEGMDVPDPYYGGDHGFESVYQSLEAATDAIRDKLLGDSHPST